MIEKKTLLIFLVPAILYLTIFYVYPLLYALYISFFDYRLGIETTTFIGIKNYLQALTDHRFIVAVKNTAIFVIGAVAIQLCFGLTLALLLSAETRTMRIIRALILLPTALPPLVVALIWKSLLHPDLGVITYYLRAIGLNIGRGLLEERATALLSIIMIDVWQWTPLVAIILLAGIKSLPQDVFEAGMVDGASWWQLIRYITLPLLRPVIVVATLIRSMDALKIFDSVWAITGGGPGTATTVLNFYIFEQGIQHLKVSYGAAVANYFLAMYIPLGIWFVFLLYFRQHKI